MQQNTEKYVLLLASTARQRNAFLSLGIQNRANLILRIKIQSDELLKISVYFSHKYVRGATGDHGQQNIGAE